MIFNKFYRGLNSVLKIRIGRFGLKSILLFIFLTVAIAASYFFILKDIPSTATIGSVSYPQSTKIYDRNGKLLYTFFANRNQTFVSYNKIPQNLKNATIAIEDRDFYKH